MLMYNYR